MAVALRELDNAFSVVRVGRQTPVPVRAGNEEDRVIGERLVPTIEIPSDAVFLERLDARGGGDDIHNVLNTMADLAVVRRHCPEVAAL